jgi:hypothetical protein
MATDDKPRDQDALAERAIGALAGAGNQAPSEDERDDLEALASEVEEPGLQDRISEKYLSMGQRLLADSLPTTLDPRLQARLGRTLGTDVSDVRVHKGSLASAAARAMGARAFAIGGRDVFIDEGQVDLGSRLGRSVLAHEVAHTKDPSAAFAMSRPGHAGSSAAEAHAERAELEYAQEEAAEEAAAAPAAAPAHEAPSAAPNRRQDEADLDKLERRVWQILDAGDRLGSERQGR